MTCPSIIVQVGIVMLVLAKRSSDCGGLGTSVVGGRCSWRPGWDERPGSLGGLRKGNQQRASKAAH